MTLPHLAQVEWPRSTACGPGTLWPQADAATSRAEARSISARCTRSTLVQEDGTINRPPPAEALRRWRGRRGRCTLRGSVETPMSTNFDQIEREALEALAAVTDSAALEKSRVSCMGRSATV